MLSEQYNLGSREPDIQVWSVNVRGDRSLTLRHAMFQRRPLDPTRTEEVLKHVAQLWGFDVHLESVDETGQVCQRFEAHALPLEYQLA
jgi:stage V sporulation protein R